MTGNGKPGFEAAHLGPGFFVLIIEEADLLAVWSGEDLPGLLF